MNILDTIKSQACEDLNDDFWTFGQVSEASIATKAGIHADLSNKEWAALLAERPEYLDKMVGIELYYNATQSVSAKEVLHTVLQSHLIDELTCHLSSLIEMKVEEEAEKGASA